jgi:LCP family protein required for cell wall assembly
VDGDDTDRFYGGRERNEPQPPEPVLPPDPAPPVDSTSPVDPAVTPDPALPPATATYGRGGKKARTTAAARRLKSAGPDDPAGTGGAPKKRRSRPKIIALTLLALILLFVATVAGTWIWASSNLTKVGALTNYSSRPAAGIGTNWLIVGSDSRSTLTAAQQKQYHAGYDVGQRSDTIMLLHYGSTGPDLISIPRDSYVTIPAYTDSAGKQHSAQHNKINAAYDLGGAQLLTQTVEEATGVRIDHYVEIGFLGVVNLVDSVGGVHMCLSSAVHDSFSGADLKAGCQNLNGTQSLEYIRSRYSLPNSDISRMADQQQFVRALADAALRPGVVLDPFTLYPFLSASLDSIAVDSGTDLYDLVGLARHSGPLSSDSGGTVGTVPIANEGYASSAGSAVLWDTAKAQALFAAVNHDTKIPAGLLNYLG